MVTISCLYYDGMKLKQKLKNIPVPIIFASAFIVLCAIALIAFAVALVAASLDIPNNPIYETQIRSRGFINITLITLFGAGSLLVGVRRLLTAKRPTNLLIILAVPLVIGTIGQTIDVIGTASMESNLIGFGILLLFLIPVVLLSLPSSRKWYSTSN